MMKEEMVQIATRISKEEKMIIDNYAKEEDISVAALIRKAIKEYLNSRERRG